MTTEAICPPFDKRVATARRLGKEAGQHCLELAAEKESEFPKRAYDFIVKHVRAHGPVPGESITLACRNAGIQPHDDRAFGSIYAKAIRNGDIHVVGFCRRVRGHGTAGGRLYAAGSGEKAEG